MKALRWRGTSLDDLGALPDDARENLGRELLRVQWGGEPRSWKPMTDVGPGVREIRVRDEHGIYRAYYVTNIGAVVYVLHVFQKKSQRTARADIARGRERLAALLEEIGS